MAGRFNSIGTWWRRALLAMLVLSPGAYAEPVTIEPTITQNAERARPMRFDRLTTDDGLSQNAVMAIAQDERGFMWFATENGLDRFDGHAFTHFRSSNRQVSSLAVDFIPDVEIDADGNLWVATDGGGIARWDADNARFVRIRHMPGDESGLADDKIETILADAAGYLWIGTVRDGLDRLHIRTGQIEHFRHDADNEYSLSNDEIRALWQDADGSVWVGTNDGLNRYDPSTLRFERFRNEAGDPASISSDRIRSIYRDSLGALWVGTVDAGLNRTLDGSRFERFRADAADGGALSNDRVEAILEDSDGRLWVGTADGLNLFDRAAGSFTTYRHRSESQTSLGDNYVISLYEDRTGILWVGTKTGGLSKWNPRSWSFGHFIPRVDGDDDSRMRFMTSFATDDDGGLWFGTFGAGLFHHDRRAGTVARYERGTKDVPGLSDSRVMTLLMSRDGLLWIGTMTGGLDRLDPATRELVAYRHDPGDTGSIAANGIMSLFEDSRGRIWIGTFGGGVDRLDPRTGEVMHFPHVPGDDGTLSSPRATAIAEDRDGRIWVGTDGGGLNRLSADGRSWQHYLRDDTAESSLSSNTVYSLHVDPAGMLWVGTRDGLDRVTVSAQTSDVRFDTFNESHGLPDTVVYGVESDLDGRIWVSTNRGLARIDPASREVVRFSENHGLQDVEFNFGAYHASVDGELFFGGTNGFNAFHPSHLKTNRRPPPVALVGLEKLNEPLRLDGYYDNIESIELDYTDDVVTFEFAALDFAAPQENQYAYQLLGFDPDWVHAGGQRRTTYTNLDGGNYVFRVKAANGDGVWSDSALGVRISVANPPWNTWWAYLLYFIAVMSALGWFWWAQQRKLRQEAEYSRRLEQEVSNRTRELAERNNQLQLVNNKLHEASYTDSLTGLRNRRYFFEEIGRHLDEWEWPSVLDRRSHGERVPDEYVFIVVDLDHFKPVNDTHGHVAGDQMLVQIADVLSGSCRGSDVVVRWGGDEFLVVARRTGAAEASHLAERIRASIAGAVFSLGGGHVARTTASIGFAAYPFIDSDPNLVGWEQVLKIADLAMYRSKEHRNAWTGVTGVDYHGSADSLLEAMHADIDALHDDGSIIVTESLRLARAKTA